MIVLKPGDLVVLKSGGPVMTVDTVNTDIFDDNKITGVLCAWFVGDKLERARFDCNAIAPAPAQQSGSEKAEPRAPEAAVEYRAMLDDMMAAMNDAEKTSNEVSRASPGKPRQTSGPKSAHEEEADPTARASRRMN